MQYSLGELVRKGLQSPGLHQVFRTLGLDYQKLQDSQ